jgi:hypothetical protein
MYRPITSKYPMLSKPDVGEPRLRLTEMPGQPEQPNPGIGLPKDGLELPRSGKAKKAVISIKALQAKRKVRNDPRMKLIKDLVNAYQKNPGLDKRKQ